VAFLSGVINGANNSLTTFCHKSFDRRTMKTVNSRVSNCVVCFYRFVFDPFRPLYPIKGYCQHSKYYNSDRSRFVIFKSIQAFTSVAAVGLLLLGLYFSSYLPPLFQSNRSLCLILTADQLFILSTAILSVGACLGLDGQVNEINSWIYIFEKSSTTIIDEMHIQRIKFYRKILITIIDFLIIILTVMHYTFSKDYLPWNKLREFLLVYCMGFQSYWAWEWCNRLQLIGAIMNGIRVFLESLPQEKHTLEKPFAKTSRLVLMIHQNVELMVEYTMHFVPLWIVTLSINLILNIYILVNYNDYDMYALSMLQMRTIGTIVVLWALLNSHEKECLHRVS
jgi:hypothetical protein